ncbi:hypothetical protein [Amycolatopsis cihanbeyliensis]|uniref:Uncharacterized protein n=1 Tax=Amycolatopsis cihanbeyliensis TaxID=1128664 RepID=A0A542DJL2_AMYCI|nr:hypothetical protein [Amycolatopsis cihanbeyliensis]TQJ03291.1 hypothetical protein FB471_3047 [Amycolatopsis cihanbeyliensis]
MSIFGQVWLWSLAAFVLGALLTWLLLVRPARSRIAKLERRLAPASRSEPGPLRQDPEPTLVRHAPAGGYSGEDPGPDPEALPGVPAEERTRFIGPVEPQPQPQWLEQDSLARAGEPTEYRSQEEPLSSGDRQDQYENQYEDQYLGYEPGAEYERQPYQAGDEEEQAWDSTEARSVLEPERQEPAGYEAAPPAPEPESGPLSQRPTSLFTELPVYDDQADHDDQADYTDYGDYSDQHAGGEPPGEPPAETPSEPDTTQVLPKRQPREVPRGGFDPPEPIQPSMRAVSRREPAPEVEGTHSGSLFQPAVPAGQSTEQPAPVPPPARTQAQEEDAAPSGPFGPGSAMPLPGGGSPGEDFRVKASVTALRYCTEDEPRYPNMVAEVWFRSPADAERVGFRPLT